MSSFRKRHKSITVNEKTQNYNAKSPDKGKKPLRKALNLKDNKPIKTEKDFPKKAGKKPLFLTQLREEPETRILSNGKIVVNSDKLQEYDEKYKASDKTECPICKKPISAPSRWKKHLQSHSISKDFSCPICKRIFTRLDHMKAHEKRHLQIVKRQPELVEIKVKPDVEEQAPSPYTLPLKKVLLEPAKLQEYNEIFQKSDRTNCPICNSKISATRRWHRHLQTHSTKKEFACRICKKIFSRGDHMKTHERRHLKTVQRAMLPKEEFSSGDDDVEEVPISSDAKGNELVNSEWIRHFDRMYNKSGKNECPICNAAVKPVFWKIHLKTHSDKGSLKKSSEGSKKTENEDNRDDDDDDEFENKQEDSPEEIKVEPDVFC